MSNISKCQHLKLYFRLKNNECIIEKSLEGFMNNSKTVDPEIWNSLKRDIEKNENERQQLVTSVKESIINTYEELKAVKALINEANVDKIELDSFKKKLQCLWKKIQEFKILCNNSMDTLSGAQNTLEEDLNTFSRSIHKHKNYSDNCHNKLKFKIQVDKEEPPRECDYNKVEDFCSLLAKTGHTGNWSEQDHLLFLKFRKKHKTIASLVIAMQAKCPDLTKECIINHEAWYKVYLDLREKQKLAVEEWRKKREIERLGKVAKVEEIQAKPIDHLLDVPEHKKAEIEKKKEKVRQWKEQKEKLRAAEEEQLLKRLKAKRENKENRRRLRALRLKKLIIDRKETKPVEENKCPNNPKENNTNVSDYPASMSSFFLQLYRLRDQQYSEKRKNIILSKKENIKNHVQPIKYNFSKKSESTLFKETKAWQEKHKKDEIKNTNNNFSYIKDLPRRISVSWKDYEIPRSFCQI